MKILYIILFIQIGWIFPLSAQKQDSIYIGTRHTLFSEILNEERKYWIYVPETKAGEKRKGLSGSLSIGWRFLLSFRGWFYAFLLFF